MSVAINSKSSILKKIKAEPHINEEMIFIPAKPTVQGFCMLPRKMAAIRLDHRIGQDSEKAKLGSILQLPAGPNLEIRGSGFNPRTIKVRHERSYYFVFEEDLAR